MDMLTQEQLNKILDLHELWLEDNQKGEQAALFDKFLSKLDFSNRNLSSIFITKCTLVKADFSKSNLDNADLTICDLFMANFTETNLTNARFNESSLIDANLSNTNISNTNFGGTDLCRTNLSSSFYTKSPYFAGAYIFKTDFTNTIFDNKPKIEFQFNGHLAYYFGDDILHIGCKSESIDFWLESYKIVGEHYGYSKKEIKQYGDWIKYIAKLHKRSKK